MRKSKREKKIVGRAGAERGREGERERELTLKSADLAARDSVREGEKD